MEEVVELPEAMICGGRGTTTPNYIRGIKFINSCNYKVTAHIKFNSDPNTQAEYVIEPNSELHVEKGIDMGGWEAVDKILSMTVCDDNTCRNVVFEPQGVQILTYQLHNDGENGNGELVLTVLA